MTLNQPLIAELRQEAEKTSKILACVPAANFDWKPHAKSMTLLRLATHIADLPGWVPMIVHDDGLDLATMSYKPAPAHSAEDLVRIHEDNVSKAVAALESAEGDTLMKAWVLSKGGHKMAELPKIAFIRNMGFNHLYHHRGQLTVFLRLLDVKFPGIYGPSADDLEMMAAAQASAAN